MAGLTPQGFEKKNLATIRQEIEAKLKTTFGFFINLLPGSVFSLLTGIFAEREASLWDLAEEVYNSRYPSTAAGVNLDNVVDINGITRLEATKSRQNNVHLFGTIGTTVPAGTQFSVEGNPTARFRTLAPVTLIAGTDEVQELSFSAVPSSGTFQLGHRDEGTELLDFDATAEDIQDALNALTHLSGVVVTGDFSSGFEITFSGDDGLQDQPLISVLENELLDGSLDPVDADVTVTVAGEPQGVVNTEAVDFGPVDAPFMTLNVIDTPVSGLDRVINYDETVLGRDEETDAELRERRADTLQIAGNATVDAIRSRLRNLEGVRDALIFENDTLVTDMDGRPGKSYECVVDGGDQQEIADTIWESKPAGIRTHGGINVNVLDSQGVTRVVRFSRPNDVEIYFSLDLTVDALLFPVDGETLVENTLIAWGNSLGIGKNVIVYPQLIAQLNTIPGILDVTVRIDTSPVSNTPNDPAVDDNITIAADEVSAWDVTRGTVNIL